MKRRTFIAGALAVPVAAIAAPLIPRAPLIPALPNPPLTLASLLKAKQMIRKMGAFIPVSTDVLGNDLFITDMFASRFGDAIDRAVLGGYQPRWMDADDAVEVQYTLRYDVE